MIMFFIMMYGCYGISFCSLELDKFINAEKFDREMVKQDSSLEEKNVLLLTISAHAREGCSSHFVSQFVCPCVGEGAIFQG